MKVPVQTLGRGSELRSGSCIQCVRGSFGFPVLPRDVNLDACLLSD